VTVVHVGNRLLGATTAWDLFALGDGVLVRVQPASGRLTRTALPTLGDGDAFLVPARGRVLIHPADYRKGYVVLDDRPAADLPLALNGTGPLLPGPDQDHVWAAIDNQPSPELGLLTLTGGWTGVSVPAPAYATTGPIADGGGYLLYQGVGGLYRVGQGPVRRVSDGALLAVGPPGWLTLECDASAACRTVLRRRAGGTLAVTASVGLQFRTGVLSPDGTTGALPVPGPLGMMGLALVDLPSGARREIDLSLIDTDRQGTLAWTPDGRQLLAVDVAGRIRVVDPRTGHVSGLGAALPSIVQIAVRNG